MVEPKLAKNGPRRFSEALRKGSDEVFSRDSTTARDVFEFDWIGELVVQNVVAVFDGVGVLGVFDLLAIN